MWRGGVWCGEVWRGEVWFDEVWCGVVCCGVVVCDHLRPRLGRQKLQLHTSLHTGQHHD